MTLRDNRLSSMSQLQKEIEHLEDCMKKKKKLHDNLSQELLNLARKSEVGKDPIEIIHQSERIQQQISENLIDIRHLDKKIARIKHRANRMKQIS